MQDADAANPQEATIAAQAAQIRELSWQLALVRSAYEQERTLNRDLRQGRDALHERLGWLQDQLRCPHCHGLNENYFAGELMGDRWLWQTSRADYAHLKALLSQKDWEAADWETQRLMLAVAGPDAQERGFLTTEHLQEFPCLDLKIINKLWSVFSEGKYGFLVQREIWARTHSTRNLWVNPDFAGYYPRREGLGVTLAQRLLRCALDDF